jgi:5'-nucleotidase
MHLLLTNDDGIDAEGIQSLAIHLRSLGSAYRIWVVAPVDGRSCCGHSVNTVSGIQLSQRGEFDFAVDGWPADCVRLALVHLQIKPDWILSGVNHGGNLGVDTIMSGTCSAAREGTWHGYKSIALSQYRKPNIETCWKTTAVRAWEACQFLMGQTLPEFSFWNVNLPALPSDTPPISIEQTSVDPSPHNMWFESTAEGCLYRSKYQERPRLPGCDIDLCFRGHTTYSMIRAI